MRKITILTLLLLPSMCLTPTDSSAQSTSRNTRAASTKLSPVVKVPVADSTVALQIDSIRGELGFQTDESLPGYDLRGAGEPLPNAFFIPAVYDHFLFENRNVTIPQPTKAELSTPDWLYNASRQSKIMQNMRHNFFVNNPSMIPYNFALLPEAPSRFIPVVDPSTYTIDMEELPNVKEVEPTVEPIPGKKHHWIRSFNVGLQFSQAYISPNWYQGGNNALNILGNIYYNVKLNQEYHPNLLFETTAQYKLGMNSAPDDSIHAYNVSDDLLQVNSTFGIKAAKRWYYSLTGQFKTQMIKSYNSNTRELRSAFLSPGELNIGLGMTYNYASKNGKFTFDASISPLSYSLVTCIDTEMDVTSFDIKEGHKAVNKIGSSSEIKIFWKICSNITLNSRLWMFTDYSIFQADWENKVVFEINRFLTTQIFCHARYDSHTPRVADSKWSKLQLKEILSIGFAYKFSSI